MSPRWTGAAAIVLAIVFALVSWVALAWEPARGFVGLPDYFRPGLLMPALETSVWQGLDRAYLPGAVAVLVVALGLRTSSSSQALIRSAGSIAAACFLLVGMTGTMAVQLPAFLPDRAVAETASVTLVAVRFVFLRAFVFSLGGFVLAVSWVNRREHWFGVGTGWLGLPVGVACLLFWLVFLPVPPALALWFLLVGIACLRRPTAAASVLAGLVMALSPAVASAQTSSPAGPWGLHVRGVISGNSHGSEPEGYRIYSGIAPDVAIVRRLSPRASIEVSFRTESREVDGPKVAGLEYRLGSLEMLPVDAILRWHPLGRQPSGIQPYVGVGLNATLTWEESGLLDSTDVPLRVGPAIQVGVDIPVSERTTFNIDARWNTFDVTINGFRDPAPVIRIDPLSIGAGIGFAF